MEANASTGQSKAYIWFNGQVVALQMNGTSTLHAVYSDHLARPFKVVDASQTTRWSARLRAFDRQVALDQIGGLNLGFAGQYYDTESGLWQNWHRFYDGTTGRYTQSDPIGLAGGINTYAYVGGNPINIVDPTGLLPCDVADMIALAKETQPDLPVPNVGSLRFGPIAAMRGSSGETSLLFGAVTLDRGYLGTLNDAGRIDLLDTIIHESVHRRQGILGRSTLINGRKVESEAYSETAKRMTLALKKKANDPKNNTCTCKP